MRLLPALVLPLLATAALAVPAPLVLERPSAEAFRGPPELAARRAVASLAGRLGLGSGSSLERLALWPTADGGHVVRFAQRHAGLPVLDAVIAVRLDADGTVRRVHSSAAALGAVETVPVVDEARAVRLARGYVPAPVPKAEVGSAQLMLDATGRLVWHVRVPTLVPIHSLRVVLDARTGELLSWRDAARYAGATKVFASGKDAADARTGTTLNPAKLANATLSGLASTGTGAKLDGATDGIVGYNCCPNANCDGVSPAPTLTGTITVPYQGVQAQLEFTVAMCAEMQTATGDANGDFLYEPAAEPTGATDLVDPAHPAPSDSDTFAEVMAYHYAERTLARMRELDPAFQLGPDGRPLRVTANFLVPNFQEAQQNLEIVSFMPPKGRTRLDTMLRFSNAMYVPADTARQLPIEIPGFERAFDSIILFQGSSADFAYDPDVVSHEFGHAVVAATAGLLDWSFDDWGLLDAPGALNEGMADFWAAARSGSPKIGEYVGKWSGMQAGAGEGTLRDLENNFTCPSVLSGEVHQDSQHFSAAMWAARVAVAGADEAARLKFDKAALAALRSWSPLSTFDAAAAAVADEVGALFDAAAKAKVQQAMAARAVTGCERVLNLDAGTPRTYYLVAPVDDARGNRPAAPGPVQFRLRPPAGATQAQLMVTGGVSDPVSSLAGFGGGGNTQTLKAWLKAGSRIVFSRTTTIAADTSVSASFTTGNTKIATFAIDGACGGTEQYLALGNLSKTGPWQVETLTVSYTIDSAKAAACGAPDAGPGAPDAGPGGADAGPDDGSGGDSDTARDGGCGCGSAGALLLSIAGLLARRRRRR